MKINIYINNELINTRDTSEFGEAFISNTHGNSIKYLYTSKAVNPTKTPYGYMFDSVEEGNGEYCISSNVDKVIIDGNDIGYTLPHAKIFVSNDNNATFEMNSYYYKTESGYIKPLGIMSYDNVKTLDIYYKKVVVNK